MNIDNNRDITVCSFLGVSIVVVFILYSSTLIKYVPCSNDTLSLFINNFIHTDILHLTANMYGLYALTRIEKDLGSKRFFKLILFLIFCNTTGEIIAHKINSNMKCSVGFSGVLLGLLAWDKITSIGMDIRTISSIIIAVVIPSVISARASFSGHLIGALSGVTGAILYNDI